MAILREWRAEIRRTLKQEYVDYVTATGIAGYRRAEGNLGAVIATRGVDEFAFALVFMTLKALGAVGLRVEWNGVNAAERRRQTQHG